MQNATNSITALMTGCEGGAGRAGSGAGAWDVGRAGCVFRGTLRVGSTQQPTASPSAPPLPLRWYSPTHPPARRSLAKKIPMHTWLAALPQLISRMCHPCKEVSELVRLIIVHITQARGCLHGAAPCTAAVLCCASTPLQKCVGLARLPHSKAPKHHMCPALPLSCRPTRTSLSGPWRRSARAGCRRAAAPPPRSSTPPKRTWTKSSLVRACGWQHVQEGGGSAAPVCPPSWPACHGDSWLAQPTSSPPVPRAPPPHPLPALQPR